MTSGYTYRALIIHCLLLAVYSGYSQKNTVIISGIVTDSASGAPLHRVHVSLDHSASGTITDKNGEFRLKIRKRPKMLLHFSHVGYRDISRTIGDRETEPDHGNVLQLLVRMQFKPGELKTFDVSAVSKPDMVFGSTEFSIADFEFCDDGFIFLTYEKRLDKQSKVILADHRENIRSFAVVPGRAVNLFKDYAGNIHVICENAVFRVDRKKQDIVLTGLPKDDFEALIKPCIDTLDEQIIFSDYVWHYPTFSYYAFHHDDSSVTRIKTVTDQPLYRMYRMEYYFMKPHEKLQARRIALKNGWEKQTVAAHMTGFMNSIYYDPLYAPLFVVDDTILIFDHYENRLYKYDEYANPIDSVSISYHSDDGRYTWKNELIMDELNDKIYGLYQKNGYYQLSRINTNRGNAGHPFSLANKYVERIKVKDDYVYYIYRPFESLRKKILYRELITER